jgi:hypothetical protein
VPDGSTRFPPATLGLIDLYRRSTRPAPLSRAAAIRRLIALALDSEEARRRLPPDSRERRGRPIRFFIADDRRAQIDAICARDGIDRSKCVRRLIRLSFGLVIEERGGYGVGSLATSAPSTARG